MAIEDGHAIAPMTPGLGIDWDWDALRGMSLGDFTTEIRG